MREVFFGRLPAFQPCERVHLTDQFASVSDSLEDPESLLFRKLVGSSFRIREELRTLLRLAPCDNDLGQIRPAIRDRLRPPSFFILTPPAFLLELSFLSLSFSQQA